MKSGGLLLAVLSVAALVGGCHSVRDATGKCITTKAIRTKVVSCDAPHTGVVVKAVDNAANCPAGTWSYRSTAMKIECVRNTQGQ